MSIELLAVGVIRRDSHVLLVRQGAPATAWELPGGRVWPGELAVEALARGIKEETGLTINGVPRLVCVGQMVNPTIIQLDPGEIPPAGGSVVILSYEVTSFDGALVTPFDPDAPMAEAAWHPDDAAAALLADHPFPFVRATSGESLTRPAGEPHHIAECYLRREENGTDSALVLQ